MTVSTNPKTQTSISPFKEPTPNILQRAYEYVPKVNQEGDADSRKIETNTLTRISEVSSRCIVAQERIFSYTQSFYALCLLLNPEEFLAVFVPALREQFLARVTIETTGILNAAEKTDFTDHLFKGFKKYYLDLNLEEKIKFNSGIFAINPTSPGELFNRYVELSSASLRDESQLKIKAFSEKLDERWKKLIGNSSHFMHFIDKKSQNPKIETEKAEFLIRIENRKKQYKGLLFEDSIILSSNRVDFLSLFLYSIDNKTKPSSSILENIDNSLIKIPEGSNIKPSCNQLSFSDLVSHYTTINFERKIEDLLFVINIIFELEFLLLLLNKDKNNIKEQSKSLLNGLLKNRSEVRKKTFLTSSENGNYEYFKYLVGLLFEYRFISMSEKDHIFEYMSTSKATIVEAFKKNTFLLQVSENLGMDPNDLLIELVIKADLTKKETPFELLKKMENERAEAAINDLLKEDLSGRPKKKPVPKQIRQIYPSTSNAQTIQILQNVSKIEDPIQKKGVFSKQLKAPIMRVAESTDRTWKNVPSPSNTKSRSKEFDEKALQNARTIDSTDRVNRWIGATVDQIRQFDDNSKNGTKKYQFQTDTELSEQIFRHNPTPILKLLGIPIFTDKYLVKTPQGYLAVVKIASNEKGFFAEDHSKLIASIGINSDRSTLYHFFVHPKKELSDFFNSNSPIQNAFFEETPSPPATTGEKKMTNLMARLDENTYSVIQSPDGQQILRVTYPIDHPITKEKKICCSMDFYPVR